MTGAGNVPQEKLHTEAACDQQSFHVDEGSGRGIAQESVGVDENSKNIIPAEEWSVVNETSVDSSAFRDACAKRNSEENSVLIARITIRELFSELNRIDTEHHERSYTRKGIRMLRHVTRGLNIALDVANPVTNFEPAAASGLAVVKSVVMVCQDRF